MTTLPSALARAFALPALTLPTEALTTPVVCPFALTPVTEGVPVARLVTDATADVATTFRGASHVSVDGARCFGAPRDLKGNLAAVNDTGLRPFIARSSATPERPAWTDLVRLLRRGDSVVLIVSDEVQRRLWPQARIGVVSDTGYPVLLTTGMRTRLLTVRHAQLLDCLATVEAAYARWSKAAMANGLLSYRYQEQIRTVGLAQARADEATLAPWRGSDEFDLSIVIAQKALEDL